MTEPGVLPTSEPEPAEPSADAPLRRRFTVPALARMGLGAVPAARSRVEGLLWLLTGAFASTALTWPLAAHLRSRVPQGTADPLVQAWIIAWGGRSLKAPLTTNLFDANAFYPARNSLAFGDSLLGYAPTALIGSGPGAALLRYNLLVLFSFALLFAAGALLGRELGLSIPAAAVAGAAAGFTPTRIDQMNHLNVLSTGGIVLTVFLLLSGYRRRRTWQVLAGWAAAVWQISLGFAMGIWFCYLLALLGGIATVLWVLRGRRALPRRLVVATAFGGASFLAFIAVLVRPYLDVVAMNPNALRRVSEVEFFSPPLRGLIIAPAESRLWGPVMPELRSSLNWINEQCMFPGVVAVVLALVGLGWRGISPALRAALAVGVVGTVLLSFGVRLGDGVLYRPLFDHLPGWNGIRTPGRLDAFWSVGLALLAGMGAERLLAAARGRSARVRTVALSGVLGLAVVAGVEGSVDATLEPVRPPAPELRALPGPLAFFPSDFYRDPLYMHWSTTSFPRIVNGAGSYDPPSLAQLRSLTSFPDPGSVALLRARGIRQVVLDEVTAPGTPWAGMAARDIAGLGITRRDLGEVLVFELSPSG